MKLNKYVLAMTCAFAASAQAENNWYVLGSVGQSKFHVSKSDADAIWEAAGATINSSSVDDTDTAYKLQIGYQFTPNFAVEGGYVDLGTAEHKADLTDGLYDYVGKLKVEAKGWNIDAVGILPLDNGFSVFAKFGFIDAKVKTSAHISSGPISASDSESSTDIEYLFGAGASYAINDQFSVRAEFERYKKLGDKDKTGEGDVDLLSAGIAYKF